MKSIVSFFKKIRNVNNKSTDRRNKKELISSKLAVNLNRIKEIFVYPKNQDFKIRKISIRSINRVGVILYLNGMVDSKKVEEHIIKPLQEEPCNDEKLTNIDLINKVINVSIADEIDTFQEIKKKILDGRTVLLVDGSRKAIYMDTVGFSYRNVEKPTAETVVKGPKESFSESTQVNRSLIRKQLRNEKLITEIMSVGESSPLDISMMYIDDIASPDLVKKIKKRVQDIKADVVQNIAILEQHLEERPYSLVPTILYTERPDRVAAFLQEGHVVLVDNSPAALVLPVTFWSFFQTAEDMYQRWAYGNFIRLIRLLALLTTLLAPAAYIAMTNFHENLLPTDLLLAIAATRENVPFPVIIEVLLMEISFELIREAGIRIPNTIGPTIGIVGALLIGQAAVDANVISPIIVIIIALNGLSSFAIPNTSLNYMIRIMKFIFSFSAYLFGYLGISISLTVTLSYLASIKSFDVPFLSPLSPYYPSSGDTIIRPPVWKQWLRPLNIYPQDKQRKEKVEGDDSND